MCAQYTIRFSTSEMFEDLPFTVINRTGLDHFETRILPFSSAPLIAHHKGKFYLTMMRFHLTPHWAKTEKVKWATYNARLETIESKSSFQQGFFRHHCLVPLQDFVEAIYEGPLAGNMVRFHKKNREVLWAAGIFDEWMSPDTGKLLRSFAIITKQPDTYIEEMGHDRQPLFLNRSGRKSWLTTKSSKAPELKTLLADNIESPQFDTEVDRPLKPGWEKRK